MSCFFAHSKADTPVAGWHRLEAHLNEVARMAEERARYFGLGTWGRAVGALHDIGKYSEKFQQERLIENRNSEVDHATAGCRVARELYGSIGHLMAYVLAGHHGGLPNWHEGDGGLKRRLHKSIPDCSAWKTEIELPDASDLEPVPKVTSYEELSFLVRMLYSALVDADHTDTSRFHHGYKPQAVYPTMKKLLAKCEAHLNQLRESSDASPVNRLRQEIGESVQNTARSETPGIFTFTAPTGAGKTLASLLFALSHAVAHGLRRVVIVIPYISVIEQNAAVFKQVLGRDVVLEHHSSFEPTANDKYVWQHSHENWDAPVVVTTAVQFFESLYSNRPSSSRKIHNLAKSVIVLDEAQTLPLDHLIPCIHALQWLSNPVTLGCSIVMCTATQPALNEFPNLKSAKEICPDPDRVFSLLQRTRISHLGLMSDAELQKRLQAHRQILCIVNTRAHARQLFLSLKGEHCYHLSAAMCPAHRSKTLDLIRQDLKEDKPCKVVATSLVEAGVDLDFPVVFRAACGLDSIAQAAGRCNREGKRNAEDSWVYVFDSDIRPIRDLMLRKQVADEVCYSRESDDILAPDVIRTYFERLYDLTCLDHHEIAASLDDDRCEWPYKRIAKDFRIIDQELRTVIVPYGNLDYSAVNELLDNDDIKGVSRRLHSNVVQISLHHYRTLVQRSAVQFHWEHRFGDRFPYLANTELYSPHFGLHYDDPNYRSVESNIL